ncbi:MAG: TfoX/Sxy family protein [Fimbriimonadaceae bacterium]|nr:TfoX/Sxy family protein [Fimbriimonadaceae bacterium]QYK57842.1 MAG: TfoX/Sxy family protein [Fimbriimonadaceae bacterium]
MPVTEAAVKMFLDRLEPVGGITHRKMFGGVGLYCGGVFFAVIDDDRLYFKSDAETDPQYDAHGAAGWVIEGDYGQSSSGFKWTAVQNPGQSFTVTCTPSASCSHSREGPSGLLAGSAAVSYFAEAFPVRMVLNGVTDVQGKTSILIGQKLVASVSGVPAEVQDPDPNTPPNDEYSWTRPKGGPFLDYNPAVLPTVFQDWADSGEETMVTYFGRSTSELVDLNCTVSLPLFALTFDVKRKLRIHGPVVQYRMDISPTGTPRSDRMYLLSQPQPPVYVENLVDPEEMKFWGVALPGYPSFYKVGATMNVKLGLDSDIQDKFGFEVGSWNYTQLVSCKLHIKHQNGNDQFHNSDWGEEGLDGGFPYPGDGGPHGAGVIDEDGNVDDVFGHQWADSPGLESIRQALLDWTWWYTRWDFKLFIFYLPPGAGSKWVPLRRYSWRCGVTATKGAQSWILTNQTNAFGMFTQYPDPFPMWTHRHGTFEWVPGPPPQ